LSNSTEVPIDSVCLWVEDC